MRIIELTVEPGRVGRGAVTYSLHPRLAVVAADADTRSALVDGLRGLLMGQPNGVGGLAEVHGVLVDLDGRSTHLLGLPRELDPVLDARRLPWPAAAASTTDDRHRLEDEHEDLVERLTRLRTSALRASEQRSALQARAASTRAQRTELLAVAEQAALEAFDARSRERQLDAAAEDLDHERVRATAEAKTVIEAATVAAAQVAAWRAKVTEAEQALAAANADLERLVVAPRTDVEQQAARERLSRAEAAHRVAAAALRAFEASLGQRQASLAPALGGAASPAPAPAVAPVQPAVDPQQRAELVGRQRELQARLVMLDLSDPAPVRLALEALDHGSEDPEAAMLAAAWVQATTDRPAPAPVAGADPAALAAAAQRIAEAREALTLAEQASQARLLDPEVRRAIEAVHDAVLEAEERADRRFASSAAKRKLAETKALEQALLTKHGLASFSDYLLTSTSIKVDPAGEARLDAARAQLQRAIDEHDRLQRVAGAPAAPPASDELARLRARIVEFLGYDPGADVEGALARPRTASTAAIGTLVSALAEVGVPATPANARPAADAWLRERALDQRRHRELLAALAAVEQELQSLGQSAPAGLAAAPAAPAPMERAVAPAAVDAEDVAARLKLLQTDFDAAAAEYRAARGAVSRLDARRSDAAHPQADRAALEQATARRDRAGEALSNHVDALRSSEAEHAERQREAELAAQRAADAERAAEDAAKEARAVRTAAQAALQRRGDAQAEAAALLAPVAAAEAQLRQLDRLAQEADAEITQLQSELDAAGLRLSQLAVREAPAATPAPSPVEAFEFTVVNHMAALRKVSFVGSVPVVFDDPFRGLGETDLEELLGRIGRLTESVQVVYLTDDPKVLSWAERQSPDRVAASVAER